jgi:hypothetical protein
MERFHKVEEGAVITLCRGVYRQSPLYRRGNVLYAGHAGGYLRLSSRGGTSAPHVSWKALDPGPGNAFSEETFSVTIDLAVREAAE